ncbi:hypothetical protein ABH999_000214 [Bradyrhizobium yuanmingense]
MRWTRQRRVRELRAGRLALREPRGFVRTSGAVRFVAPAFRWQRAQRRRTLRRQRTARTAKPCGPGRRCYGQALANAALASTGAVPVTFAGAREARGNSAPGRARHKPSDHRAGKAVCWASPVCCCAVLPACALAQWTAGAAGTRPSLRPLGYEGGEIKQSSGEAAARPSTHVCVHTFGVIARLDRAIQYSETPVIESRGRGVLDSPLQCAIAYKAGNDSVTWRTHHRLIFVVPNAAPRSALVPRTQRIRAGALCPAKPSVDSPPAIRFNGRVLRRSSRPGGVPNSCESLSRPLREARRSAFC